MTSSLHRVAAVLAGGGWVWLAVLCVLRIAGGRAERHHFETAGLVFGAGLLLLCASRALAVEAASGGVSRDAPLRPIGLAPWAVALAAGLVFAWSVGLGPLSDDFVLAAWARSGDLLPPTWPYVRPVPLAVWRALLTAGADWPAIHGVNLTLHAVNALLVCLIVRRRLGDGPALVAGLVYATLPTSIEAVVWGASVFDLAMTCFVLLAVLVAPSAGRSPLRLAVIAVLTAAALLSKEVAVVLPGLLLLDALVAEEDLRGLRRWIPALVTAVASSALYILVRVMTSNAMTGHLAQWPAGRRQWKDLVVRPFASLAVPLRMEDGIRPEHCLAGLVVMCLLGALVLLLARRADPGQGVVARAALIGALWVAVTTVPLLTQFYVGPDLAGSRYLYLPAVGFAWLVAAGASATRQQFGPLALFVLLLCLSVLFAREHRRGQDVWKQAASTRDTLLEQAHAHAPACSTIVIDAPPDSIRGAYVFREGLPEAVAALPLNGDGRVCRFTWKDDRLEPAPS